MTSFKTGKKGNVFPVDDEAYKAYLRQLVGDRKFEDLPAYEKARIEFKAAEFARAQRFLQREKITAQRFERRSMNTPSDIMENRKRLEALAKKIASSSRPRRQRMRYNEQMKRFEFVEVE